jgi:glucosyl-3-phosphoglycerate phosphatase
MERHITTVLLVRHGATDWNFELRAQGHADVELNEAGRAQARSAAAALASVRLDAVYASDLRRALDTARPIAETHGLEVTVDPDLREIDQGQWTGLTDEEIRARWPERWGPARHYSRRPGGESPAQVRARALGGVDRIVSVHPNGTVVVVSHGVTIRTVIAQALGLDDRGSATLRGLSNGGIVSLEARRCNGRLELGDLTRHDGLTPARDDPNQ